MLHRPTLPLLALFAGLCLCWGCEEEHRARGCAVDADCRQDRVCVQGQCADPDQEPAPDAQEDMGSADLGRDMAPVPDLPAEDLGAPEPVDLGAPPDLEQEPEALCLVDEDCVMALDCCGAGWGCFPADAVPFICDADCDAPRPEGECGCSAQGCAFLPVDHVPEAVLCEQSGGRWGDSDCESCCGPNRCGQHPGQQDCALACCGPAQCYCPEEAPFWGPEGCFDEEACYP